MLRFVCSIVLSPLSTRSSYTVRALLPSTIDTDKGLPYSARPAAEDQIYGRKRTKTYLNNMSDDKACDWLNIARCFLGHLRL